MKVVKWILKSLIIALAVLFITNFIGAYINVNIPINVVTILTVMFLRIPGVIVLIILFLI